MLIAFDGLDGAGKTTQVNLLIDNLKKRGIICHMFDMGGFGVIGKYLNALKHHKINCSPELREILYYFEGQLFTRYYLEKLKSDNQIVICDRWILTYLAYGQNNGLNIDEIKYFINGIKIPDIYFFVDIDPIVALGRIEKYRDIDQAEIGYGNKMSSDARINRRLFLEAQNNIRQNFKKSIDMLGLDICFIDGNNEANYIEKQILTKVLNYVDENTFYGK